MDDNKVIRQLIRVNLELEGLEVVTAADGVECLDVVHQFQPDVITLDVVMPRLDGLHTAARLRSDPRTRHLPLAIVSACSQYEVEAGLDVGVDAFLAKPFEPVELVRLVHELMQRRPEEASIGGDASAGGAGSSLDSGSPSAAGVENGESEGGGGSGINASVSGASGVTTGTSLSTSTSTSTSLSASTSPGRTGASVGNTEPTGHNGT